MAFEAASVESHVLSLLRSFELMPLIEHRWPNCLAAKLIKQHCRH